MITDIKSDADMDKKFNELLRKIYEILKPLGYRKETSNYRFFGADGLCRIINFQKNKWNTKERCEFVINIGIYFEKDTWISNRKFKEYDCQIRKRLNNREWAGIEWWHLDNETDMEELLQSLKPAFLYIEKWFCFFPSKETVIRMILDGTAGKYSTVNVMHFHTAKLLVEMGYPSEVYKLIKDTKETNPKATMLIELAEQIKNVT